MIRIAGYAMALCAAVATACSHPATVEHKGQSISLTDSLMTAGATDTLRFGHMNPGEIAVKTLTLRNSTETPFVIMRHETTCHCATLEYAKHPVKPDESIEIRCSFDSRGEYGWQMKLVNFYISGAARPVRVFIEADIE